MKKVQIPKEFIRPGLIWGSGIDRLFVHASTKEALRDVPDEIEGMQVEKHVTGSVRPAG
jgi:hypothetical protein